MTEHKSYFTGLSRSTFLLALTSCFADISTEMLYPVLPIFLTQTLGASTRIVGLVEGVAEATQNIVQGFSGWIADKLQKRKSVALLGYSIAAIAKPFMGLAPVWQVVLGARFMDRFGTGTRSAPRDALIAASADEASRGKAFGLEGIGDNLGAFIGPLIAIVLLFGLHINLRSIFYFAFIPGILAVLMILFVKEKTVIRTTKIKIDLAIKNFPSSYWKYLAAIALFGLGNSSNSFLILRTKNIGMPLILTILVYACFNLVAAFISYPAGTLSDRLNRKNILLLALAIFFVTYLGFATSHNLYLISGLFMLYGLYQGIFRSVGKALATDFTPTHLRASGIGWYSTTVGLSSLIASLVGGELWTRINPSATFFYGAILSVLGGTALFLLVPKQTSKIIS